MTAPARISQADMERAMKAAHPDGGGSKEDMAALTRARDEAMAALA